VSLSWGRRSAAGPGPTRAVFFATVTLVAILAGSDADGSWPSVIEPRAPEQIQALLDRHLESIERRDLAEYSHTVDGRSTAFYFCMREFFDLGDLRAQALRPNRLRSLEQVSPSLARGFVEQRDGIVVQYFRRSSVNAWSLSAFAAAGARWSFSQPDPAELGERRTRTIDGVTLTYWQIDEHMSELLAREAALARDSATRYLSSTEAQRADLDVVLLPRRELTDTRRTCLGAGWYDQSSNDVLVYRYSFRDRGGDLSDRTKQMIRHEALHWAQWRRADMRGVDWWLREGWPQHVLGEELDTALLARHACPSSGRPPTLTELMRGPGIVDPSGERALMLYAAAQSLMAFVYEIPGVGDPVYWAAVHGLSEGRPRAAVYEDLLGRSFERLHQQWLERTRQTLC
jgi:hypothetical protein